VAWFFALVVSTNSFSSLVILFSSQILTMVYNTWSHWASGVLNTRKNNVSGEGNTTRFLFGNIVFFSIQNSGRWPKSRKPLTSRVMDHGQKPSECKEKTG
jgi:hypothetical protein